MSKTLIEQDEGRRHWCSQSEEVTSGDALVSMLDAGWQISSIARERHHFSNARQTTICAIQLERQGQVKQMRVISNPYITRLLMGSSMRNMSAVARR